MNNPLSLTSFNSLKKLSNGTFRGHQHKMVFSGLFRRGYIDAENKVTDSGLKAIENYKFPEQKQISPPDILLKLGERIVADLVFLKSLAAQNNTKASDILNDLFFLLLKLTR